MEAGLRIPDDVAVTGCDDIGEAAWTTPPLTTVGPDLPTLVRLALDAALGEDDDGLGGELVVPHALVTRDSTAPRYPHPEGSKVDEPGRGADVG